MKKLLKYMKGYGRECFLGPLLKLLEAALELLVPYVIFDIINTGIVNDDRGYIVGKMFILIGMGLAGLLFSVAAQYFSAKAAVGFSSKVREALFAHIMRLGYPEIDKTGKSTFITRLTSDINQVQTGINLTLRLFLRSPFIVFGAMICAFTIDKSSAMVFVGVIPVLALVVFAIMLSTIPLYRKVQQKLDVILSKTRENLSGVRMLRALCKEDEEISEFGEKNNDLNHAQKFVGKISALMNPLTYVIINAAIKQIEGFSGHADQSELLEWVSEIPETPKKIFLVHGEDKAINALKGKLQEKGYSIEVPEMFEEFDLGTGEVYATATKKVTEAAKQRRQQAADIRASLKRLIFAATELLSAEPDKASGMEEDIGGLADRMEKLVK